MRYLTCILILCCSADAQRFVKSVSSISQLVSLQPNDVNTNVFVAGYYTSNDGGGGIFRWNGASSASTNLGTVFKTEVVGQPGRWERIYSGAVNVRWFGAKGDGIADDYASINDALTLNAVAPISLFFPNGTYKINTPITVSVGCTIYGEGAGSVIQYAGPSVKSVVALTNTVALVRMRMSDLSIAGSANSAYGLYLTNVSHSAFDNLRVRDVPDTGVFIDGTCVLNKWSNLFVGSTEGGWIIQPRNGIIVTNVLCTTQFFINPIVDAVLRDGIQFSGASGLNEIDGGASEFNGTGIHFANTTYGNKVTKIDLEGNATNGFSFDAGTFDNSLFQVNSASGTNILSGLRNRLVDVLTVALTVDSNAKSASLYGVAINTQAQFIDNGLNTDYTALFKTANNSFIPLQVSHGELNVNGPIHWSRGSASYGPGTNSAFLDNFFGGTRIVVGGPDNATRGFHSFWAYNADGTGAQIQLSSDTIGNWTFAKDAIVPGDIILSNTGGALKMKLGANCAMGTSILVGGTVTVNNTTVASTSEVFVNYETATTVTGILTVPRNQITANQFVINSLNPGASTLLNTDTNIVRWVVFKPSP